MNREEIEQLINDRVRRHEREFSCFGLITTPIVLGLIYLAVKYGL